MSTRTPSYRLHKPIGQAVVTLDGRDIYLGKHGSTASRGEYDRIISEWLANGRRLPAVGSGPADLTVSEVMVGYLRHADGYYLKDGRPTSEARLIRAALKALRPLYGHTPARGFGPLALKAVRQTYIDARLCRDQVNKRVGRVVRMFRWAVENELVPPALHHGLKAVAGLRKGRSEAHESPPVRPAPEAFVEAVRPHVSRPVWAMVELQRLTGMRSGEVTILRTCDLDTSGRVWAYAPGSHKTEHQGKRRTIYLGPKAQEVLGPWLRTDLAAYLFSPREAMEELWAARRKARKTRVQPSQQSRKKRKPRKTYGQRYSTESYRVAIARGCDKAGVPRWHPHQLRGCLETCAT